jgi:5'(3')-deoxyribonucleotidase
MDCVLVDFISAIEIRYDVDLGEKFGYDISSAIDTTWENLKYALDEDFWHMAPITPWAQWLMKYLHTEVPTYIVTSCEPDANHQRGKLAWLHTHFPYLIERTIFMQEKSLLSRPDRLLIDDLPFHCNAWVRAGGQAVCVPARWSHTREEVDAFAELVPAVIPNAVMNGVNYGVDTVRTVPIYSVNSRV